jgi:hypothetical protein
MYNTCTIFCRYNRKIKYIYSLFFLSYCTMFFKQTVTSNIFSLENVLTCIQQAIKDENIVRF